MDFFDFFQIPVENSFKKYHSVTAFRLSSCFRFRWMGTTVLRLWPALLSLLSLLALLTGHMLLWLSWWRSSCSLKKN